MAGSGSRGPRAGSSEAMAQRERWRHWLLWVGGLWISPFCWLLLLLVPADSLGILALAAGACGLAPLPVLLFYRRYIARLNRQSARASEEAVQLKLHLETIRYRTGRLREELSAADRQARLSHQLALLGQFTAGFLHEFNNPLAIVTNRIEVLLEERKDDASLCADLNGMLKEARYMGSIAGTLLRALRHERGEEVFAPCIPADALQEVISSAGPSAEKRGVRLLLETAEAPRINLPAHVLIEITRSLVTNALDAVAGRQDPTIWIRLETYRQPGSKVILRVEDNGPGVPEELRGHLFEPFVSRNKRKERLGLGLFLAASLLDTYDGSLRYEPRTGGGACFVVELPPARFTKGQPYHWFVKGAQ